MRENKREYTKPLLNSRKVELGVFGDYGEGDGGNDDPRPIKIIPYDNLHLE